jgi:hypothetical protein
MAHATACVRDAKEAMMPSPSGTPRLVNPVRQELDPVFVLDLQVFFMRIGNALAGDMFDVVTIQIQGHVQYLLVTAYRGMFNISW